jgi:predicted ribosome quality control (RQC) complex YloA/Tae2 family protein
MEISGIEINLLCKKISESTSDYFVSGIYSMEEGALLRVNHSTRPERLIAVSSFAGWITTKNLSVSQATKFVSRIRELERFALLSIEQVGNERIAKLVFKSRKGDIRNLYAEFFSRGNLILTDPAQGELIVDVEKPQSFRHRDLEVGHRYLLPPSRGVALQDLNFSKLTTLHKSSIENSADRDLSAVRWFGRSVGTSRKFVEEIFFRADVNSNVPSKDLAPTELERILNACESLKNDLHSSAAGYILLPAEDNEDLDIDVCPIIPNSWKRYVESGQATVSSFPSLSDALDEILVQSLVLEKRRSVSQKTRAKAAELSSAIAKQEAQIELNTTRADELRNMAKGLMTSQAMGLEKDKEVVDKLISLEILELARESANQPRFVTEPRSFLKSYSATGLGSRLFDESKRLEGESQKIREIMLGLEQQRDNLEETTRSQEEKAERKMITERRERQWFERYRWFVTSDGRLCLGGRDSTSNSIVVNKYTQKNDIVFHADLHGSPFFILKNEQLEQVAPPDEVALEVAQATVGFSRAWKDELGSADAFWILPDQVKKSAPSGEYLARGSFFIEGKKNFVRHVKVELSVGIMTSKNLPSLEKNSREAEVGNELIDSLLVVCGPEKSISGYSISRVKIAPGKEKGTMFARRIKQQLVNRIKDEKVKEASKKLPLDDILRVLPAGAYKFVSEKQNN